MRRMAHAPEIRRTLAEARRRTDELFAVVKPDALYDRPVPERHRLNFYIGHMEAFDWNMVCAHGLEMDPLREHPGFNELFAFGIDPDSSDLPTDKPSDWPDLAQTGDYCRRVRSTVDAVLDEVEEELAHVCIEHRLMHAETLCYLLHNLAPDRMQAPERRSPDPAAAVEPPENRWINVVAGHARLGRGRGTGFGWDNEFEELEVEVPTFSIGKHKVTNGAYLDYVREGGAAPHYWRRSDQGWRLRTMFGEVALPLDWPVYVTHEQARQYAARAGAALPTEAQWDRAAYGSSNGASPEFPWGGEAPSRQRGNFDFGRWDPCSVTACPEGDSACGVSQLMGNGWEWTADTFKPFPGFRERPFYPDYSRAFFDDKHYVLKGGSPRTSRFLLRRTFRNWFRDRYPYVHATFRLVQN